MGTLIYYERKSQGICVVCGKSKAEEGKVACMICAEKQRLATKERRDWLKRAGVCPQCGQNDILGDEVICPECAAKKYVYNLKSKSRKAGTQWGIKIYAERKSQKICVKCGKREAEVGKTRCAVCNARERERGTKYRQAVNGGVIPKPERASYKMCYFCGKPVIIGKKVCFNCRERLIKNLGTTNPAVDHPWRKEKNESKRVSEISNEDK